MGGAKVDVCKINRGMILWNMVQTSILGMQAYRISLLPINLYVCNLTLRTIRANSVRGADSFHNVLCSDNASYLHTLSLLK